MRIFIIRVLRFSAVIFFVLIALIVTYTILDPFKILRKYPVYYNQSENARVGINKDYVSTNNFEYNNKKLAFNSFIFGNSRSINYQISDWKKYLPDSSNCYHFDAAGETLFGIYRKVEYLNTRNVQMKNVLMILDEATLSFDKSKSGHLFIISPKLVGYRNIIDFHLVHFTTFISPKFLYAFIDFTISGKVKPYMKANNLISDDPLEYDGTTNEIRRSYFESLINQDKYYTPARLKVFYKRSTTQQYSREVINESKKQMLSEMHEIFKAQNTNLKIIISPLYNQLKLNSEDLAYLKQVFGQENVFDFSGINEYTQDYKNYYEASHYRPSLSRELLRKVYLLPENKNSSK